MFKYAKLFLTPISLVAIFTIVLSVESTVFAKPATSITVVAEGLHSPRGLAFGPGGILYVAQAGDAGHAGSIIEFRNSMSQNPTYRTIIDGLASTGGEGEFLGVSGISVLGRGANQGIFAIFGLSPQATGNDDFGALQRINLDGTSDTLANVGSFDFIWTGDHASLWEEFPDANPYGVLALPDHIYVADAGANTLDEVLADGSIRVLAYFPNEIIRDAIPTCVAQGPDGALYVGTLTLVESIVFGPSAKVYRVQPAQANLVDPTLTPMTVWASGLWPINGCTFGPDGNFYASQLFTHDFDDPQGDVVEIRFSSPETHTFLTDGALSFAGGVAVGPNGDVFVADGTAFVENGRVLRLGH
jgi:hypothetical protein